ncbi:maleylpyruvate isomerase family mycothiol-dependent enzyme [Kitasatospora cinereorecta]|uniref:Maleylpyruvate isomerase family mycothiol-dependent enzyme n=1 Tax=Kitasatospora cinereorecta TaxID=285560 RepID=A0ABW0VFM3_9ACTN
MTTTAPVDHAAAVARESARFVDAVVDADPSTPVPTCPDWTLTDLVRHAGSVHRWFSVLLTRLVQEPPRTREVDLQLPDTADGYPGWLAASAEHAAGVIAGLDPHAPMWAWGVDQHARFWVRRMLFETLIHRVDAELALGRPAGIDRALAVDGIDEFLVNLPYAALFAPDTVNLRAEDRTVRFRCTDGEESFLVRLRPDGFALEPDSSGEEADAEVGGAAADLLLLLYGRLDRSADAFRLAGDPELLATWFAHSAF